MKSFVPDGTASFLPQRVVEHEGIDTIFSPGVFFHAVTITAAIFYVNQGHINSYKLYASAYEPVFFQVAVDCLANTCDLHVGTA